MNLVQVQVIFIRYINSTALFHHSEVRGSKCIFCCCLPLVSQPLRKFRGTDFCDYRQGKNQGICGGKKNSGNHSHRAEVFKRQPKTQMQPAKVGHWSVLKYLEKELEKDGNQLWHCKFKIAHNLIGILWIAHIKVHAAHQGGWFRLIIFELILLCYIIWFYHL